MYFKKLNECGKDSSKIYGQLNILRGETKNSNIILSGKLPLPLTKDFKIFFYSWNTCDNEGFHNFQFSEGLFSIPDFPLDTMYVLAPVTIE